VIAAALGGAVGIERELREREAGLRTHLLVAVGSALFTIASAYGFNEFLVAGGNVIRADPTRIAAQIVTGIGFLGAGAIIREGMSVRGLTTAATLWVVAAIGIAAGAGYYSAAVLGTAIVLFSLWPLRIMAYRLIEYVRPEEKRVLLELAPGTSVSPLLTLLEERGVLVESLWVEDERDRRRVVLTLDHASSDLVPTLADLDYVVGVQWRR
jgi:putative Mg2+ transporter-C (MgtC) family protein